MNCIEVQQQIELYVLDGVPTPQKDRIKAHLAVCSDCREIESQYRMIKASLKETGNNNQPRPDFENNVMAEVENEIKSSHKTPSPQILVWTASVAACLFVGITIWKLWPGFSVTPEVPISIAARKKVGLRHIQAGARSIPMSIADDIAVHGNKIYFLLDDGLQATVASVDSKTGKLIWKSDVQSHGFITADDSRIYCVASNERGKTGLVAINQSNGEVLWQYSQQRQRLLEKTYMPTVMTGQRICWIINSTVHVLSSDDGKVLWTHFINDNSLLSTAKVTGDSLYIASAKGLYCFDIPSGQQTMHLKYNYNTSRFIKPLLAASEGKICIWLRSGTSQSRLLYVEQASGQIAWTKALPRVSHLCIGKDKVYVRDQDVIALNTKNGELLWSFKSKGCSPMTYADDCIFFADSEQQGHLIALDEKTGRKVLDLAGIRSCNRFIKVGNTGYLKTLYGIIHLIGFKG